MKLSEVYRRAALYYLWDGQDYCDSGAASYSCDAISAVDDSAYGAAFDARLRAIKALGDCGQDQIVPHRWEYRSGISTEQRQSERFMWLWLLALEAEDEGL
jgi:hypothetical protein